MKHSGVAITITSITDFLAIGVGAASALPSSKQTLALAPDRSPPMCCVKLRHMFARPTLALDPTLPLAAHSARPAAPRDSRVNRFHHRPLTYSKHLGIGASPYPKRHWRGGYRAWFQGEQFQPARATLRQPPRPKPSWEPPHPSKTMTCDEQSASQLPS